MPTFRAFLTYFAAFFAFGLAGWIGRTFGEPSIDQIVYHLRYAEGEAVHMSGMFVGTFIAEAVAFPLLFATGAAALHALVALWRPQWRRALLLRAAPRAALLFGLVALPLQFSAFSYVRDSFGPDRFSHDYVDPRAVRIAAPSRPRNLVLVYVESLEETYGEASLFGRDLLAPLHALPGARFDRYVSAPGTTWTMGGIVATQCGVPLRVYSESDLKTQPEQRTFLPGATCLGDVLHSRGYRNVFLGGAPLSFSGKGVFLRDHGYEAYGRDEWETRGVAAGELNEWGLYDDALFKRAREMLRSLHDGGRPFNLTLLTIDTHNPHGFLGSGCRSRGAKEFEGVVACSAAEVSEFIQFARTQGYLENTAVVVMGDHPAVPNPAWDKLQRAPQRRVFNLFMAPELPAPARREMLPFDMFPTILELMGMEVPGGRLGLGYAGFRHPELSPPAERVEGITTSALRSSSAYGALWNSAAPSAAADP